MKEVLIIFSLLVLNGVFAMCEIALVSSRKARLQDMAGKGNKGAKISLQLLQEPEKFLSAVQIGITLVGIIAGAYGGESFTDDIQPLVEQFESLKPIAEEVTFILIVTVITYFTLIIGELVPKTIALNNPEKLATVFGPFMRVLTITTFPLVWLLSASTKVFLKILFIKENKSPPITEEELKYMIDTGSQHGVIEKRESEIMHGVLSSADIKAVEIMTGSRAILWVDVNQTSDQIRTQVLQSGVSKFPVCDGSLDNLMGVASLNTILNYTYGSANLKASLAEPVYFSPSLTVLKILDDFRKSKTHMGFVKNENGKIIGLITLYDVIEKIVGAIPERSDLRDDDFVIRADGSFLADGGVMISRLQSVIRGFPPALSESSLSDFIFQHLTTDVKTGTSFRFERFCFEIVDMDGSKIDKVLISRLAKQDK